MSKIKVSKQIEGKSKPVTKKDGTVNTVTYPSGTIEVLSIKNDFPMLPDYAAHCADNAILQWDASRAWQANGGDMTKLGDKQAGKALFWDKDEECVGVNWEYIKTARTSNEDKVDELVKFARNIEKMTSGQMKAKDYILQSLAPKNVKESALAQL